jgi:hypothetical protein
MASKSESSRSSVSIGDLKNAHRTGREWTERELRRELDPETVPEILNRIFSLAHRASELPLDEAMMPGVELIARVSSELGNLLKEGDHVNRAGIRGDLIERHRAALEATLQTEPVCFANYVLTGAARRTVQQGESQDGVDLEVSRMALLRLQGVLPRGANGQGVLEAIRAYRDPLRRGRPKGKAPAGVAARPGTFEARALALTKLLGLDITPKTLKETLAKCKTRAKARVAFFLRPAGGTKRKTNAKTPRK